jgi:hypothetical protein
VQGVREGGNDVSQECGASHFACALMKLDDGEFRDTVDRQEHDELAFGKARLTAIDMDEADFGFGESSAFRWRVVADCNTAATRIPISTSWRLGRSPSAAMSLRAL